MKLESFFNYTAQKVSRYRGSLLFLFLTVLFPLFIFAHLADEVREQEIFWFDEAILIRIHSWSHPYLDVLMVFISKLGYWWGLVPLDLSLSLWLIVKRKRTEALFFILSTAGAAILNSLTKWYFERQRPALWMSPVVEHNFSFPSGHAMASMALVVAVVVLLWSSRWRYWVVSGGSLFVILVCYSRLYLGVHYPSDILAGVLASLAWVMGLYLIFYHPVSRAVARRTFKKLTKVFDRT